MTTQQDIPRTCPNCTTTDLYTTPVSSGGGYAPDYLPQLREKWYAAPNFNIVVCAHCGLTQFFTPSEHRAKLPTSSKWRKL